MQTAKSLSRVNRRNLKMSMPLLKNPDYIEKDVKDDIEIISEVAQEIDVKDKTISIISSGSPDNRIGI